MILVFLSNRWSFEYVICRCKYLELCQSCHVIRSSAMRGCGWPRWFAHKPLHLIVATSRMPSPMDEDYSLGSWNSIEWVSVATNEAALQKLVEVMGIVMERCEQTLTSTSRVLCCWLRSWGPFYAYPFALPQRRQTQQRYYSYLGRFLCYVFRSWRLCLDLSRTCRKPMASGGGYLISSAGLLVRSKILLFV